MHPKIFANLIQNPAKPSNGHEKFIIALTILCIMFSFTSLFGAVSFAATHYVSPSGGNTWAQSVNIGSPCTVNMAMSNAVAGDTVIFLDGTYNVGEQGSNYDIPVLNPSHSGTAGNYITFRAQNQHLAVLNGTVKSGDCNSNVIGSFQRDYIIWDGFKVTATSGGQWPTVRFKEADHCTVTHTEVVGGTCTDSGGINIQSIRTDNSTNITISYCSVHDGYETNDNNNYSVFENYNSDGVTIEYSEFYNSSKGLFLKDGNDNFTIRYNYIHDMDTSGIHLAAANGSSSSNVEVYGNLVTNCRWAMNASGGSTTFSNVRYYNNTIYNATQGIAFTESPDVKIYNNIISTSSPRIIGVNSGAILSECDHNQFNSAAFASLTSMVRMRVYAGNAASYNSLSSWQSSGELSGGRNPGAGSLASDPQFANASGHMNEIADFALSAGSPCKGSGRSGADMGADISLISRSIDDSGNLSVPTNLRVIENN